MTLRELADKLERVIRATGTISRSDYADLLEQTGRELIAASESIRRQSPRHLESSTGGVSDRVKMQVFGPAGDLKQSIERN